MADQKDPKDLQIEELTAQVKTLTTDKATLTKQVETLEKASAEKDKQLDAAKTVVTELKTQLAEKDSKIAKLPTVVVGKDTYELLTSFTWGDKVVTAELLKSNSALAAELVKEGVGDLRLVSK